MPPSGAVIMTQSRESACVLATRSSWSLLSREEDEWARHTEPSILLGHEARLLIAAITEQTTFVKFYSEYMQRRSCTEFKGK